MVANNVIGVLIFLVGTLIQISLYLYYSRLLVKNKRVLAEIRIRQKLYRNEYIQKRNASGPSFVRKIP